MANNVNFGFHSIYKIKCQVIQTIKHLQRGAATTAPLFFKTEDLFQM